MDKRPKLISLPMNYETMPQADVPQGRKGKHKQIVNKILNDLAKLRAGSALRIPLVELGDSKENVRSALNRACRQRGLHVATASDELYLYVWQPDVKRENRIA